KEQSQQNIAVMNGDSVSVRAIPNTLERVVTVKGAVELPGSYSLNSTPNVSSLVEKGRLKREALLDIAFLLRTDLDSNRVLVQLDLGAIMDNPNSAEDLSLQPKDVLLINEQQNYADRSFISVTGAVRNALNSFALNPDSSITIQQAILLAGGLIPEAADFGYLIRTDANNNRKKEYIRIDVKSAMLNPKNAENLVLQPFDELVLLSNAIYTDQAYVSIKGAVHLPQELYYSESLTLKDALSLVGGLKDNAAQNRIEIFRIETDTEQPTKTIVATLSVDEQLNPIGITGDFKLLPYDEIVVRELPNYELQRFVQLEGEVLFPGTYALVKENESLASIIQRAGGVTPEAFLDGVNILRSNNLQAIENENKDAKNEKVQRVVLPLRKENANNYNYLVQNGDVITVPKQNDVVEIVLANTGAQTLSKSGSNPSSISVAFVGEKSAKWYIQTYAGGFGKIGDKKQIMVEYPNGAVKNTQKMMGIFYKYPKPVKGSTIYIGAKPPVATIEASTEQARPRKGAIIATETTQGNE
ncbi:MAG: SLBB domain-containing protein, partial [Bacteroidota bacterium]